MAAVKGFPVFLLCPLYTNWVANRATLAVESALKCFSMGHFAPSCFPRGPIALLNRNTPKGDIATPPVCGVPQGQVFLAEKLSKNIPGVTTSQCPTWLYLSLMHRQNNSPKYRLVRLVLVDRHVLFAEGLRKLLQECGEVEQVAIATNQYESFRQVELTDPDVILLDPWLNGSTPVGFINRLREISERPALVFLEDSIHEVHLRLAIKSQARGYLTKSCRFTEIRQAIQDAAGGLLAYCTGAQPYVVKTSRGLRFNRGVVSCPMATLTPREMEILVLLARGLSVRQAAKELKVAISTVDNHKSRIMRKLDVHKVVDLATMALREGLLP